MTARAAPHTWPYEGHRTMAEVLAQEERSAYARECYRVQLKALGPRRDVRRAG